MVKKTNANASPIFVKRLYYADFVPHRIMLIVVAIAMAFGMISGFMAGLTLITGSLRWGSAGNFFLGVLLLIISVLGSGLLIWVLTKKTRSFSIYPDGVEFAATIPAYTSRRFYAWRMIRDYEARSGFIKFNLQPGQTDMLYRPMIFDSFYVNLGTDQQKIRKLLSTFINERKV